MDVFSSNNSTLLSPCPSHNGNGFSRIISPTLSASSGSIRDADSPSASTIGLPAERTGLDLEFETDYTPVTLRYEREEESGFQFPEDTQLDIPWPKETVHGSILLRVHHTEDVG